jgi:hypothetical protein
MIHKTSTRGRLAALASGALVAGGLVVAPAVVGLSAANAAPATLNYTCSGSAAGQSFSLPGTLTAEVAPAQEVAPSSSFTAPITMKLDLGAPSFGPVTGLTGTIDVPVSVGGSSSTFTTKSIAAPMTALVYEDAGTVSLTSPATPGEAAITVGTLIGNLTAQPFGLGLVATCAPDAGQDLTVGHVTVSDDAPPPPPDPVAVPVTGTVKVTGAAKVGKTLKAIPGVTDGATVAYQWLSNGQPIANATMPTLKVSKALKGKKVSVQATYSKTDFLDVVQVSKAVKVKK